MFQMTIPANLTPPKDFAFVKRLLEKNGSYRLTFLDTSSTEKAYKWFLKHQKHISLESIVEGIEG